jgi:hypothetical protein
MLFSTESGLFFLFFAVSVVRILEVPESVIVPIIFRHFLTYIYGI